MNRKPMTRAGWRVVNIVFDIGMREGRMVRMARERQIALRMTEEEYIALERAARKDRRTVSDFIREAIMLDLMLVFDHTFMSEVRRQLRQAIEDRSFQGDLPIARKKRA